MFKEWIAVALGGMLGAVTRHALYWLAAHIGSAWLPIATLIANVVGCFLIGVLVQWSHQQELTTNWIVVGARVGFLGGLTTFSAFGLDLVRLWYENRSVYSLTLAVSHVGLGVAAVVAGMALAQVDTATADVS